MTKIKLFQIDNFFVFKKIKSKKDLNFSLNIFAQALMKYFNFEKNQNLLISYQGNIIQQNLFNNFVEFFTNFSNVYIFNKNVSIPLNLDEYVLNNMNFDYLIKGSWHRNTQSLKIKIYSFKHQIDFSNLNKVLNYYNKASYILNKSNRENLKFLNLNNIIKDYAKNGSGSTSFENLKERYKAITFLSLENYVLKNIVKEIFKYYKNNYHFTLYTFKTFVYKKIFNFLSKKNQHRHHKISFKLDSNDHLNVWFEINKKFIKFSSTDLVLLYLNFFFEEVKRNGISFDSKFVLISHESDYKLVELLKMYKIKYFYYSTQNLDKLKDPNCWFAFVNNKFLANLSYAKTFDNFHFILCLMWMMNTYSNRNNLLNFKLKQLEELFGVSEHKITYQKINQNLLPFLIKSAKLMINKKSKLNIFDKINIFDAFEEDNLILFKFLSDSKNSLTLSYNYMTNKLKIDSQVCEQYDYESKNTFLNKIKIKIFTFMLIKKAKKLEKIAKKEIKK
ncbi:hypothetical protein MCSF7_01024 [Mycoplasmopsis columbina SF7]|uniref:Uncharacterized protein n=1 Tax=Mycoplasmopsis columbina SF7 TaxID=1037410 RepID=F9UJZ8_9BACT|nr:hypothetical protein [Mycoplasmopsis columbina]EGV00344.1 hypothetical protein MCSF7_01024 [Mycoplasmopsis columbina SF7]